MFAANVRTVMADYLNVSTTNHTYEDCRLMLKAGENNLPFESALIEFTKLKEKLKLENLHGDFLQKALGLKLKKFFFEVSILKIVKNCLRSTQFMLGNQTEK